MTTTSTPKNYAAIADQYVDDVLSGRRDENKLVIQACERHRRDLKDPRWSYVPALTNRVCRFIECLPYSKGRWAAQRDNKIKLQPWQCFVLSSFGWLDTVTRTRKYQTWYFSTARKQGKSEIVAAIIDYLFLADGEVTAQTCVRANTERQGLEVFRPARQMLLQSPDITEAFGVKIDAKSLTKLSDGSTLELLVGKASDKSASAAVIDEYHEADSDDALESLRQGFSGRENPALLVTTTAGYNLGSPCHQMYERCVRVLDQREDADTLLVAIWKADDDIDWTSERAIRQAQPNFGIAVYPKGVLSQRDEAIRDAKKASIYKTKQLNLWVNSASSWLNLQDWSRCGDAPPIEEMQGHMCWLGVDLSSKIDLSARVLVFRREIEGKSHFYLYSQCYVPGDRLVDDPVAAETYSRWLAAGYIRTTEGAMIDYDALTADVIAICDQYGVREMAFDPTFAGQFAQTVGKKTTTIPIEVPFRCQYITDPMSSIEALLKDGRLHHANDPVLTWCFSNVVVKRLPDGKIFADKPKNVALKTDAAAAGILAMSRAIVDDLVDSSASTDFIC